MKNAMIISGYVTVAGFMFGALFKAMHWPGAAIMLLLAMITASLVFLPLVFILKIREQNQIREKMVTGLGVLFGILLSVATMFKLFHWPGANVMTWTGFAGFFLVYLPVYFFTGIRNPETKMNTIVSTVLYVLAGGLIFSLMDLRAAKESPEMKMYAYLEKETLLQNLQESHKDTSANAVLSAEINKTCADLKAFIIENEIRQKNIPQDFLAKDMTFGEHRIGRILIDNTNAQQLLATLREKVSKYNAAQSVEKKKIPVQNNIISIPNEELDIYSNYFILNALTQIQMHLAVSGQ